jgi:hypothetical protein
MIRTRMLRLAAAALLLGAAGNLWATARQPVRPGVPVRPGGPPLPAAPTQYKELVPALTEALGDSDAQVRQSAAAALVKIGHEAVAPLIDILGDTKKEVDLRANAAYVLGQIGAPARDALPALGKALKDHEADVRRRAAFAVARILPAPGEFVPGAPLSGGPPGPFGPMGGGGAARPAAPAAMTPPDPGVVLPGKVDKK